MGVFDDMASEQVAKSDGRMEVARAAREALIAQRDKERSADRALLVEYVCPILDEAAAAFLSRNIHLRVKSGLDEPVGDPSLSFRISGSNGHVPASNNVRVYVSGSQIDIDHAGYGSTVRCDPADVRAELERVIGVALAEYLKQRERHS